jgi:uncharacterized protein (DUF3084 family)
MSAPINTGTVRVDIFDYMRLVKLALGADAQRVKELEGELEAVHEMLDLAGVERETDEGQLLAAQDRVFRIEGVLRRNRELLADVKALRAAIDSDRAHLIALSGCESGNLEDWLIKLCAENERLTDLAPRLEKERDDARRNLAEALSQRDEFQEKLEAAHAVIKRGGLLGACAMAGRASLAARVEWIFGRCRELEEQSGKNRIELERLRKENFDGNAKCVFDTIEALDDGNVPIGTVGERVRWVVMQWREEHAQLRGMRDGLKQCSDELKEAITQRNVARIALDTERQLLNGRDGLWRRNLESALGLEPDPANHTIGFFTDMVGKVREIGNGALEAMSNETLSAIADKRGWALVPKFVELAHSSVSPDLVNEFGHFK